MRYNQKQSDMQSAAPSIFGADFHRFMEIEGQLNRLEIAEDLGISLGDVKKLKEKLNRA
ncbi:MULTISPECIES: 4-alpha-glucanotransferase [Sediminibacillus]|uniref:4-alpha-glucanotransferase n=1 Tax=Sediminibacillus TaxID=482460 RepID=UPI000401221F|nr:4-alpha-glucanotransferase [Sediminibacillus terrae]